MLLKSEWAEPFLRACEQVKAARRRSFAARQPIYLNASAERCYAVGNGYVKLVEPRTDGSQFVRLVLGRGALFGDPPFGTRAFGGFATAQLEHAIAHGPAEIVEMQREDLEAAARADSLFASRLLESVTARSQFLERRLMWQFISPMRSRIAAALRDLICFEGQRCRHGHTIDVRLTHQDLAEFVGAARPVVSAEIARLKGERLLSGTRIHFCVDDLDGLNRVADARSCAPTSR